MVHGVLPRVPLLPEHSGRGDAVCGPRVLSRLVEFQQSGHFLEDLELAGSPVVRAAPLQAHNRVQWQQNGRVRCRILRLRVFSRVPGLRPAQDLQGVCVHGHDVSIAAYVHFEICRRQFRSPGWQRHRLDVANNRSTAGGPHVLPRLRCGSLWTRRYRVLRKAIVICFTTHNEYYPSP